jgi:glycosyltransferase involved in cell wall biosynthesis
MFPTPQCPSSGTFVEQQIEGLKRIGLEVGVLFVDRQQKGMSVYATLPGELQARIADFRPDLVHSMYGGVMADLVTFTSKDRPTIVSFCGTDLLGQPLSGPLRTWMAKYGVRASHRAANRASGIVVKSKNLEDALPSYVDRSKVRIIPNGIDLERFKPIEQDKCRRQLGWHPGRFHILFCSNFGEPIKRFDLALASVAAIRRSGIDAEMHLLRGVSHAETPIWLNACDVLLLTSVHEGSPNIIKEALACNLPIVSVDVGDVRERIQGVDGCYLASPEPEDLSRKLLAVLDGPGRVNGRIAVLGLSVEEIAVRLRQFYREILGEPKNQGVLIHAEFTPDKWSDRDLRRSKMSGALRAVGRDGD